MVPYYGDFPEDAMVYIPFNTFSSDDPSASVTISNLADTDIYYHKNGSTTDYSADAATAVSIDFDGITGNHMLAIDTSENAYFATGSEIAVRMEGTTVDGATINAFIGSFSIERTGGVLALLKAGTVDVNAKTVTAGAIANASFNADVGSTAHGTNIIALACRKILEELNLDHLLKVDTTVAVDGDLESYVVAGTVLAHLMAAGKDVTAFKCSTDSLEAIKVHADTVKAETALIVADTNELQTDNIPGALSTHDGKLDTVDANVDSILTDTGTTLDALIKDVPTVAEFEARSDVAGTAATPAEVNAEVLDVLNVDTFAEPGQEAPPATTTLVKKIGYSYKLLRNKITNDGTDIKVYNDAKDTVDQKSSVSEADGTVTRDEFGSGP